MIHVLSRPSRTMEVLSAGLRATVQDLGRFGRQNTGINPCGVMDRISAAQANFLVGNPAGTGVLEFCLQGPTLSFTMPVVLALTGGDFSANVDGQRIPAYESFAVEPGQKVSIQAGKQGTYGYLAVNGGFDLPLLSGSQSTNLKCGIGGWKGRCLKAGDRLPLRPAGKAMAGLKLPIPGPQAHIVSIRVIPGPQDALFSDKGIYTFYHSHYLVSAKSDRMGLRMEGAKIEALHGTDIISDGIPLGSVQIAGDGQPIVMMADHQTTGGYAKIAVVAGCDLPVLAQLRPGTKVHFFPIDVQQAQLRLREQAGLLEQQRIYLQEVLNDAK